MRVEGRRDIVILGDRLRVCSSIFFIISFMVVYGGIIFFSFFIKYFYMLGLKVG